MGKLKGGGLSRKELRKAHKQAAKEKKQQRHNLKQHQATSTKSRADGPDPPAPSADKGGKARNKRQGDIGAKPNGGFGGGGSSNGVRRKRWRPEELDPMIAAEDAELKRLERLLGVSGPNAKKKRAKLEREIEVEDGMGDEFGAFLADLDRIGNVVEGEGGSGSSDNDQALMEANWDFHENVPHDGSAEEGSDGAAEQGEDDDSDVELGDGGREPLEGVVESDDDFLESIQEGEEEKEERGGEGEPDEGVACSEDGLEDESSLGEGEDEESDGSGDIEGEDDDEPEKSHDTSGYGYEDDDDGGSSTHGTRAAAAAAGADGEEEKESEDFQKHTYRPNPGQDIYGRTIAAAKGGVTPPAYVPPHLRAAVVGGGGSGAADDSGRNAKRAEVQRVVNGIMNRLSEETLEPVTARLREAYRSHSTTETNEALWQATKAVCVHDKQVMTTLIPSFTAVIAALDISLGADVGGFFLETIAKELNAEVWGAPGEGEADSAGRSGGGGRARRRGRGTSSNLTLLLAYLYNYGVAHCTLVYDIIGLLVDAFGADEMELLLLLLRHSGFQLRSDDSQALKQIVALVKEKYAAAMASAAGTGADGDTAGAADGGTGTGDNSSLAEETGRWKAAFGPRAPPPADPADLRSGGSKDVVVGGSRARYILDTIVELQGNKRSRIQEQGQESGRRVRRWLGSVKAAKGGGGGGGGGGDSSLRVTWAELVSTESKGRWWRVGAAWAGRGGSPSSTAAPGKGAAATAAGLTAGEAAAAKGGSDTGGVGGTSAGEKDSEAGRLLALAARQRMNTDVRRSVFVAIVGSSDCEDALEKILRLNLRGAQEREIARVIVECCSQEVSYNPFYAHLAERVCDRQPKLRFTFQVAFWDALKTLDDGAARRAGSLARLMAHLVIRKQLSLTVLKTVDVQDLSPSGLLLMRVFFHEIIAAGDDASFMEIFRRLVRPAGAKEGGGHSAARDNALVFLRGRLGPAPAGWDRGRRKAFRKRVKGACRLIEAIATADELG